MTAPVKKRRHRSGPPPGREFRLFAADGLEVRNEADSDQITITGTPIVYNTPYSVRDMFGEFEETMLPGVADDVLAAGADVRFLINHAGLPLARTTSRTLSLDVSNRVGLPMTATLDARSSMATDLAVAIERGDVTQMSCGFVVAADTWNDNQTERSISKFKQLFDVSAVTYPASPTTSIELAYRSLFAQPVESQARVRQLWVEVGRSFRSGDPLSAEVGSHLQSALGAMTAAADDLDITALVRSMQTVPAEEEPETEPKDEERTVKPTDAPATADERRAAAGMTYNDVESALSDALAAKYASTDTDDDAYYDMWVVDATDEWVVWRVYGDVEPGSGLWQINYTMTDGAVTLVGDPVQVTTETSYVAVQRSQTDDAAVAEARAAVELLELELEQEQMQMRAKRRRISA